MKVAQGLIFGISQKSLGGKSVDQAVKSRTMDEHLRNKTRFLAGFLNRVQTQLIKEFCG